MAFIPMQCPQCSGSLEFDDSREFMFCSFCGTKVMRNDVITANINVNNEKEIRSNLEIGKDKFLSGNYSKAKECAERAVSLDSHIADGWLLLASIAKLDNNSTEVQKYYSNYEKNSANTLGIISKELYESATCCYVEISLGGTMSVGMDVSIDNETITVAPKMVAKTKCSPGKHVISARTMGIVIAQSEFTIESGTKRFQIKAGMFGGKFKIVEI